MAQEWEVVATLAIGLLGYMLCDEWGWRRRRHWTGRLLRTLGGGFLFGGLGLCILRLL